MTDMIDSAIEKLLDKRGMDWNVRHQEGDPFYFIKGYEKVELQSGGDLLWLYKADGTVEEFNDRMIEEAVKRLIEEQPSKSVVLLGRLATKDKEAAEGVEKAKKKLKLAIEAVTVECLSKHGYVPAPVWCEEDHCYIFGGGSHLNHEAACQFLWDNGIDASDL